MTTMMTMMMTMMTLMMMMMMTMMMYQELEDGRYSRVADLTESVAKCDVGCLYTRDQVAPINIMNGYDDDDDDDDD